MGLKVLQIGPNDWSEQIPSDFEWTYTPFEYLHTALTLRRQGVNYVPDFDAIVLSDAVLDNHLWVERIAEWPSRMVFYVAEKILPSIREALQERGAFAVPGADPATVLARMQDWQKDVMSYQLPASMGQVNVDIAQTVQFDGQYVRFSGDFGQSQGLMTYPLMMAADSVYDVWLDATIGEGVEVTAYIDFIDDTLQQSQMIPGKNWDKHTTIGGVSAPNWQLRLVASGHGEVQVRQIYLRESRHGIGHLWPGDQWERVSRGELIVDSDLANRAPQLLIVLGHEETAIHQTLRATGQPYIHIVGAWWSATQRITQVITDMQAKLGITAKQTTLLTSGITTLAAFKQQDHIGRLLTVGPLLELDESTTAEGQLGLAWRQYLTGHLRAADGPLLTEAWPVPESLEHVVIQPVWGQDIMAFEPLKSKGATVLPLQAGDYQHIVQTHIQQLAGGEHG
jgi:hypothetical protein